MATFYKDKASNRWDVEIDVVSIGAVRRALGINLLELFLPGSELLGKFDDPCLMVDVLYVLSREQADQRQISDVAFGRLQTPDSIHDGMMAVLDGVANFTPGELRLAYQKVVEKVRAARTAREASIKQAVMDPAFEAAMDREIGRLSQVNLPPTSPSDSIGDASSLPESSGLPQSGATPSPP